MEVQKTNEEIVEEFRERFPQFRGVGARYPMFDETPVYTHVIQFIEYALTLKDEAHRKEMEEAVKRVSYEIVTEFKDSLITIAIENEHMRGCVTSNQINRAFADFEMSTHDALTPTKEVTEELPTNH